jgi:hypothetical protein
MSAGITANNDGSAAITVGGNGYIEIAANGVVDIPVGLTVAGQPINILPAGSIIQIVQSSTVTSTATTSTSDVTTTLTGSITPSSATSKILVQVNLGWIFSNQASAAGYATFALYRGASSIVSPWFRGPHLPSVNTSTYSSGSASYLDSPSSASAVTYTLFFNTTGASTPQTVQASSTPSFMTLYEIKQ